MNTLTAGLRSREKESPSCLRGGKKKKTFSRKNKTLYKNHQGEMIPVLLPYETPLHNPVPNILTSSPYK